MGLLAGALLLAGCGGGGTRDSVDEVSAERMATSSHLTNNSDVPIAYDELDPSDPDKTLAAGDEIVGPGGAWKVPRGWQCVWHTGKGNIESPVTVTATDYDQWTTFSGYDEVVDSCQSMGG